MSYKRNYLLVVLILLCLCFKKVRSDGDKTTIYVTVTANATEEEPTATTTIEELPTQTVEVEDTEEYQRFVEVLGQTKDDCMYHAYIVSLNLFHANQIGNPNCENQYYSSLESLRKKRPCKYTNSQLSYAIDYMDAHIRLLCSTRDTGERFYEQATVKEICPIIHYLKTNTTRYEEELFKGCNLTNQTDTCIEDILTSYKEMKTARDKLNFENRDHISYKIVNETVTFNMNITDTFFDSLNDKCPMFSKLKSSALSLTVSFTTLLIYSLFVIFINL